MRILKDRNRKGEDENAKHAGFCISWNQKTLGMPEPEKRKDVRENYQRLLYTGYQFI